MTETSPSQPPSAARTTLRRILNPHGLSGRGLFLQGVLCIALAVLIVDRLAHALFWPAPDARDVLVVSSERCPWSHAARQRLDAHGVPYRLIDSEADWLEAGLAGWAFQSIAVPVVVVGPDVIHGYDEPRIDAAVASLGYTLAADPRR